MAARKVNIQSPQHGAPLTVTANVNLQQFTKSKSTTRSSAAASDCPEATRCIQKILRISTTVAGTSRHAEKSTKNGGCGFSDRNYSRQYTVHKSLTSAHRHNRRLERTQRSASIHSQHARQEIILNAVVARFLAQHAQRLSPRTNKMPIFELLVREMARNGGDLADLGALMDAWQIDASAAELEEIYRDMRIDKVL
ncbi:hypothetical protein RUND412_011194 [Rhizina undulata]